MMCPIWCQLRYTKVSFSGTMISAVSKTFKVIYPLAYNWTVDKIKFLSSYLRELLTPSISTINPYFKSVVYFHTFLVIDDQMDQIDCPVHQSSKRTFLWVCGQLVETIRFRCPINHLFNWVSHNKVFAIHSIFHRPYIAK